MEKSLSRRNFIGRTAAGVATFSIVPRHVLGGPGQTPPSEVRGSAVIGLGRGMGFVKKDGAQPTLAVCELDQRRMERGLERAAPGAKGYKDFRYILDRDDIEQVYIAPPPHWHAVMTIMAAKAGKHVMCEKPLARTIGEGKAVVEAIRSCGCNFRYGAYCTGTPMDLAAKAYHSRLLGWPLTVYQAQELGCPFKVRQWTGLANAPVEPIPDWMLDWDMYCGPSPLRPFQSHRFGGSHRGYWDYDGGGVSDMGGHILNGIVGAIDKGRTSPVEIETDAPPSDEQAVGIWYWGRLKYADGTTLVMDSGCRPNATPASERAVYLEGPKGVLYLEQKGRSRVPRTDPPWLLDALKDYQLPGPIPATNNLQDPVDIVTHAHRAISVVHLLNIAIRMGRTIQFDPVKDEIIGDEQANSLINQPMRAPWHV